MSLPGLELTQTPVEARSTPAPPVQHSLPRGSEWRFEIAFGRTVRVKLLAGTAELFGTELASSQTYTFSGTKAAIYTWHGCTLEVSAGDPISIGGLGSVPPPPGSGSGGCQVEYVAEETPMAEYVNIHGALETMREEAKASGREGPRVLILGAEDAGKTSLAKILTGYATKRGRQPVVVNLDPSEGMLSVPGSLTATVFQSMIDVEEGWGSSPMSGPSPIPVKLPLVYFYGLPSPLDAEGQVYKPIVSRLALAVAGRLAGDKDARESGCIIDTPGVLSQGKGEDLIHHIVTEFSVTTILVLGSERLYSSMVKQYDNKPISTSSSTTIATVATGATPSSLDRISVVKVTKSGGCVDRDASFMKSVRDSQIRSYFFGNPIPSTASSALSLSATSSGTTITLSPHAQQLDLDSLSIFTITATPEDEDDYDPSTFGMNDSFLPGGINDHEDDDNSQMQQPQQPQQQQYIDQAMTSSTFPAFLSASNASATTTTSQPPHTVSIPLKKLPPSTTSPAPLALENTLLAITHAAPNAPLHEIRDASIMGFVYVAGVDEKKAKIRVLAPVGGRVPARAMIWGRRWPGELVGLVA
ncbi:pre-mRNA cleavage complex II protein Clp1 [Histoplasma capsulatum G186AR]|uniref:Polynucleotide 5'-hydroxyl-kinase GRC3 n=2 Tax=Ajellomyces capsulatus TaxID=5037 RepID=C0NNW0_AJECG|nr:pre-mRNA cleavage complex II protein Clp1 [Histoplasma capsulatum G186AR]EEH06620.1 pre-mRNA cleavage complex II protein Clp1 [Histoplasma capsulatum G186AR]KAG5304848.1 pre-mRNA cleavage complex II protein Clp1 [Histoplasma capsulatum]QSS75807.1 pre-mRNA cleavage complex II protein Clp1 [Histoplasma capsulatum G186AR]